jgi:hypothetical protein
LFKGGRLWRPRFLINLNQESTQLTVVKILVNLGHHLENLPNTPIWAP